MAFLGFIFLLYVGYLTAKKIIKEHLRVERLEEQIKEKDLLIARLQEELYNRSK
jgi:arginine exporter protein ArgO